MQKIALQLKKVKEDLENFNFAEVFEIEHLKKPRRNIDIERFSLNKYEPPTKKIKEDFENFKFDEIFEIEHLKKPRRNIDIERVSLNKYGPPFQEIPKEEIASSSSQAEIKSGNSFSNKLSVIYNSYNKS